ncbi:hypothetical protein E2562_035529 [Oryza meyeriana var. granulata]|uniref:Uncharacterized protein n=1 Tax=Oryza meyeriana var. granulata TaxID=110450 RepID=A0A6G1E7G1_9ORYZ|nr:hypothetical protein E2562_035529 [Oryza meyeriana var. granulata]
MEEAERGEPSGGSRMQPRRGRRSLDLFMVPAAALAPRSTALALVHELAKVAVLLFAIQESFDNFMHGWSLASFFFKT